MTRPCPRRWSTILLLLALVLSTPVLPGAQAQVAENTTTAVDVAAADPRPAAAVQRRPNLVLITSDDQSDTELRWMPRTRRLLEREGINFVDGINPHPLCCPGRAEILTGEYAQNNGVRHNDGPFGGWPAFMRGNRTENLAAWLHRAGYRTGFVGKNLNGYTYRSGRPNGWDFFSPTGANTYAYYGTEFFNNGSPKRFGGKYVADIVRDESRRLIRNWAPSDKPFFLWASHVGPHDALVRGRWRGPVPAKRHAGMFGRAKLPSRDKPSFQEKNRRDKPGAVRRSEPVPLATMTSRYRDRLRSLQAIDEANAATIRQLAKSGELANTVIVYVSDNGFQLGEHDLFSKNYPYAENLQIPFLMRGPGIPKKVRSSQTASMVDIAPTFLDYAGVLDRVRKAGHTDGEALQPVIQGRATLNTTTLIQGGTKQPKALRRFGWEWRGVRTTRYTYVKWWDGFQELYDHRTDPYEESNLMRHGRRLAPADRAYTPVVRDLRQRYQRLARCSGLQRCERQDFGPEPVPTDAG